jgi:small subunit ribosomal protein S20
MRDFRTEGPLANTRSAEKRIRQEQRRSEQNRAQRSRMKTGIKKVMTAESPEVAEQAFRDVAGILDRLATRRIIHPNKAARKKSQLARRVKSISAAV